MATRKNTFKQAPRQRFRLPLPGMRLTELFISGAIVAVTVLALVFVSFGVVYAYKKVTTSEYFTLNTIEVFGTERLTREAVVEAAGISEGENSFSVRLDEVESRLRENPWVAEVDVKRVLPARLEITVIEHEPKFWIMKDNVLFYADQAGTPIDAVSAGRLLSLPTLHVEEGADRYRSLLPALLADIEDGSLPLPGKGLAWIRLSLTKGIECKLEGIDMIINLGLENYADSAARVALVLADLDRRGEKHRVQAIRATGEQVWISRRS